MPVMMAFSRNKPQFSFKAEKITRLGETPMDQLSNLDLDILIYGLEDHIKYLQQFTSFMTAQAMAETKELLSRIEHEKIRRQNA